MCTTCIYIEMPTYIAYTHDLCSMCCVSTHHVLASKSSNPAYAGVCRFKEFADLHLALAEPEIAA